MLNDQHEGQGDDDLVAVGIVVLSMVVDYYVYVASLCWLLAVCSIDDCVPTFYTICLFLILNLLALH